MHKPGLLGFPPNLSQKSQKGDGRSAVNVDGPLEGALACFNNGPKHREVRVHLGSVAG